MIPKDHNELVYKLLEPPAVMRKGGIIRLVLKGESEKIPASKMTLLTPSGASGRDFGDTF